MTTLRIGIASYDDMKASTLAIARGKLKPKPSDPKVWFTSPESLAKVLSINNRMLLDVIATAAPSSLAEIAERTGRAKSNLSRTLKTLERYGLVKLVRGEKGRISVTVPYSAVSIVVPLRQHKASSKAAA